MSAINNFTLKIPSFSLSFYFSKGKARDIAYSFCFRQIEIKIPLVIQVFLVAYIFYMKPIIEQHVDQCKKRQH